MLEWYVFYLEMKAVQGVEKIPWNKFTDFSLIFPGLTNIFFPN